MNYTFIDKTVRFLGVNDILRKDDYIRDLYEDGEEGGWYTTWRPNNWRGSMWHTVEQDLHGWIGCTYKEYMDFAKLGAPQHEIIRIIK